MRVWSNDGKVLTGSLGEQILGAKRLPVPVCQSQISWTGYVSNPGLDADRPTTKHLKHGTTSVPCRMCTLRYSVLCGVSGVGCATGSFEI
jgi:hypothetical protein